MTTNADLIAQWRSAHPTERLSVPVLALLVAVALLIGGAQALVWWWMA